MTDETNNSPFDDWTKDDRGDITLCPLMGYASAISAESACMLRLQYAPIRGQLDQQSALQLAMTPYQAIELAQALLRIADRILQPVPPRALRN